MPTRMESTPYGFHYGAAEVSRLADDPKYGWSAIGIKTRRVHLQIVVTRTGKVIVSRWDGQASIEFMKHRTKARIDGKEE